MGEDATLHQTAAPSVAAESTQVDDAEPTLQRQAELRATYAANVAGGKAPYVGARIHTRGEVGWICRERNLSIEIVLAPGQERPNLSGADLGGPTWAAPCSVGPT